MTYDGRYFLTLGLALGLASACANSSSGDESGSADTTTTGSTETGNGSTETGNGSTETGEDSTETGEGQPGMADIFVDRCDPSLGSSCDAFIEPHLCCSDDPVALDLADLAADVRPAYLDRGGEGIPVFSGINNALSRQGVCVAEGSVPPVAALADEGAQGCPVPCNPQWDDADIEANCGAGQLCCQVQELEPEDCVLDPSLGDAGCYRPVTGNDIVGLGGADASDWSTMDHATHQDPGGWGCDQFVSSLSVQELSDNGLTAQDVQITCFRRLAVADRRGICLGVEACPYALPNYADACETLNFDNDLAGC